MHIRERAIGTSTVLAVAGDMTMGGDAKEFRDSIDSLVARAPRRIVITDFH